MKIKAILLGNRGKLRTLVKTLKFYCLLYHNSAISLKP